MDGICGSAESAQARRLALQVSEKGKTDIPGSAKPVVSMLSEGFRTQPAPTKTDEIQEFGQGKASLPAIDLPQPLLEPDQLEYNPLAHTAAAHRFDAQTRALLSSRPHEAQEKVASPSALARLKLVAGHINPHVDSTVSLIRFDEAMRKIASAAKLSAQHYDADMDAMYQAERRKQDFIYKIAVAPLTEPYAPDEISKMQRLNALHKQEQSNSRFAIFDRILTPYDGAFDPSTLASYHSELEKMSVSDLEKLIIDERLVNRHNSNAFEHLSSIFAMAHYQLGLRGPASGQCQHFYDAWDAHAVVWRKADAGWQFIKHTLSYAQAHEMLEAIFRLPNLPWHRAAFTCHHFAMREDTPLPEKIQYFFLSASFHQKDERILRQYRELQKLDQNAVQAYIKERAEDPNLSSLERERFAQYLDWSVKPS